MLCDIKSVGLPTIRHPSLFRCRTSHLKAASSLKNLSLMKMKKQAIAKLRSRSLNIYYIEEIVVWRCWSSLIWDQMYHLGLSFRSFKRLLIIFVGSSFTSKTIIRIKIYFQLSSPANNLFSKYRLLYLTSPHLTNLKPSMNYRHVYFIIARFARISHLIGSIKAGIADKRIQKLLTDWQA